MLLYMVLTVLVGLFYLVVSRRTAYLSRRQWASLERPDATAAVPETAKSPPATTTVTRIRPAAIEARRK